MMTDHLKTLRELVAAGEKATPGEAGVNETNDGHDIVLGGFFDEDEGVWRKKGYASHQKIEYQHGCGSDRGRKTPADRQAREAAANAHVIADYFNARPALAALLRVVDAAKAASVACKLACDAKGADKAVDGWYQAQAALDAALRDLSPGVEDGE